MFPVSATVYQFSHGNSTMTLASWNTMPSLCKMLANPQWAARPATVQDQPSSAGRKVAQNSELGNPSDLPTKSFPKKKKTKTTCISNSPWPPTCKGMAKICAKCSRPKHASAASMISKISSSWSSSPAGCVQVLETRSTVFHCSNLPKWHLFGMNWIPLNSIELDILQFFPAKLQKPQFLCMVSFPKSHNSETVATLFMKNSRHFQAIEGIVSLHSPAPPRSNDPCPALFGPPGRDQLVIPIRPYENRACFFCIPLYKSKSISSSDLNKKTQKISQLFYHSTFHYGQFFRPTVFHNNLWFPLRFIHRSTLQNTKPQNTNHGVFLQNIKKATLLAFQHRAWVKKGITTWLHMVPTKQT